MAQKKKTAKKTTKRVTKKPVRKTKTTEKNSEWKKYKWFYTNSGKLVVGGKNAEQNDELIKKLKSEKTERLLMHTKNPGSPFCAILENPDKISEQDMRETAIFTASHSQTWKTGAKQTEVHAFKLSQTGKTKGMKQGTWGVKNKIARTQAPLKLAIIKQDGKARAVPEKTIGKNKPAAIIIPGKTEKEEFAEELFNKIKFKGYKKQELLEALPAGKSTVTE